ncbi:hypothetical protein P7H21_19615 [Paenibacillus larvae]|nr:hypothetical protein [Paenibacillus larvae]MDT2305702.1 hypothetical protein [Paenibacillus larvae]
MEDQGHSAKYRDIWCVASSGCFYYNEENEVREKEYQKTISENQEVIRGASQV